MTTGARAALASLRGQITLVTLQIQELESTLVKVKLELAEALAEKARLKANLTELEKASRPFEVSVSDHAVLRYMERVMQLDVESVRNSMLSERNIKMIEFAKDCRIKQGGVELVVKDGVVLTVVSEGTPLP